MNTPHELYIKRTENNSCESVDDKVVIQILFKLEIKLFNS